MAVIQWFNIHLIRQRSFACGHCGDRVGVNMGWPKLPPESEARMDLDLVNEVIVICPSCEKPTYLNEATKAQVPGPKYGREIGGLPTEVSSLYAEARNCMGVNAFTASVLACRKLLMHIAVSQGAAEGSNFIAYVNHLQTAGFVPPTGRAWVDHIRNKGNEANHEILLMTRADAESLLTFIEMLLQLVFEFPAKVPVQQSRDGK